VPDEPELPDRARLAAEELARAKADARARGDGLARAAGKGPPGGPPAGTAGPEETAQAGGPATAAGPARRDGRAARGGRPRRARRDDPERLRSAIGGLLDAHGWRGDLAIGAVFGRWDQIVGADLAAHTRPEGFSAGELLVTADSTAWATQVRLLAGTLVARVNAELGGTVVRRVKVRGPAPPPRSGQWRVRGGRGPRDDYG
jgi:predicted nucleic acid-binding Zn ribbon protein